MRQVLTRHILMKTIKNNAHVCPLLFFSQILRKTFAQKSHKPSRRPNESIKMLVPTKSPQVALHFWECNYLTFIAEIRDPQISATRPYLIIDLCTVTTYRSDDLSKSIGLYCMEVTQNPNGMTNRYKCIFVATWCYASGP